MGTDRREHWKGHATYRPRGNGGYKRMEARMEEHKGQCGVCLWNEPMSKGAQQRAEQGDKQAVLKER